WLGVARFQLNDYIRSVQALRSAEKLGLGTASLHKALALAYYSLHQYYLFEKRMNQAAKLDPRDSEPLYYLGRYYESVVNNFGRALDFFDRAVQLSPKDVKGVFHK